MKRLLTMIIASTMVISMSTYVRGAMLDDNEFHNEGKRDNSTCTKVDLGESIAYLDAEAYQNGFLVVGTEGRMDQIAENGSIQQLQTSTHHTLLDVAVRDKLVVAVGVDGTVVMLEEGGRGRNISPNTTKTFYSSCFFKDSYLVGGEKGVLYSTLNFGDWKRIKLPLRGTITGINANGQRCIGVTDQGETFVSTDGIRWNVLDYNEYYGKSLAFTAIEVYGDMFAALGVDEEGMSRMMITQEGGVWTERTLTVGEETENSSALALAWDGQQMIVACKDGRAITLPDCTACNQQQYIGEDTLYTVASNEGKVLFAGTGYATYLVGVEGVRQYNIKSAAVLEKQQNGALLIDVRDAMDYVQKHITGSVNLEISNLKMELPVLAPNKDQELIFYCQLGKRSQRALEQARDMGYRNVYNLGAIDNWEYAFDGRSE